MLFYICRYGRFALDLEKGNYYYKIDGYNTTYYATRRLSTGNYSFKLSFKNSGATVAEPNNNIIQSKSIVPNKDYKGQIAINDDEDYYRFKVGSSCKLIFKITSYMPNYCSFIYDENGKQVWETQGNSWISTTKKRSDTHTIDLKKGTYYLKIDGYNTTYYATRCLSTGNYTFKVYRNISVPKIENLKASSTLTSAKLVWNAAKGVTGYTVYSYNSSTKKYTKLLIRKTQIIQ